MSGGCGGSGMSSRSPADPFEESGSGEWRRIYDRVEALLPQVENSLRARLVQAEASRRRWKEAYIALPFLANPKIIELREDDSKDYGACEDDDYAELEPKEATGSVELSENNEDHEAIAGELREELRKLKQAYITLSSDKDKEISALLVVKDFLWNQLRTIDKENSALLKIKEVEAAQATEAAQKLKHNIEELQVATRDKDDMVGRLQVEAANVRKRTLILDGKLLEMHSLVKDKNDEIQKLQNENTALLKIKEVAAAQATEAARKLQHNIKELQVATRYKDDKVGKLQVEAANVRKRTLILDGKLLEMHSLVKDKNDKIQKLQNENKALLKIKEVEAAQTTKAAQKLQVAARDKDDKVGRLQEKAAKAKKRLQNRDDKLREMHSLVKEKNDETPKLNDEAGQKRRKTAYELSPEKCTMQVFVKIRDDKTITLEVKRSDTIYSVKAMIQDKEGIPACQQRLMFDNKLLVGSCTLKYYYNIQEDSTLTLHLVLQGMHILVKTLTGRIMTFEVERADTVYNVKGKIFDETGYVPAEQRLIFAGKLLAEDWTLADYDMQNDAMLHLLLRLPFPMSLNNRTHIVVRTPTGRTVMDRFAMSSETVSRLKAKIHVELCIPPELQHISSSWLGGGEPLENDCILGDKFGLSCNLVLEVRQMDVSPFRCVFRLPSWV